MRSFVTAAIVIVITTLPSAQQPAFRAGTRVVPVVTTVVDSRGHLVGHLERDDFAIFDNGKLQEISVFEDDVQPFTAVVMLDNSASMAGSFRLLKAAAAQFLLGMLPADRAQVGAFSDEIELSGDFTSDPHQLMAALDHLPFGDQTRLYDGISASIARLRGIDGRKIVLVFTDGDDTASDTDPDDLLDQARAHEVSISIIRLNATGAAGLGSRSSRRLTRLVHETGGCALELRTTEELAPAFTRIAQELHSAYTLGFSPARLDGRTHEIVVHVRRPALTARARRSYVATTDRLDSPVLFTGRSGPSD